MGWEIMENSFSFIDNNEIITSGSFKAEQSTLMSVTGFLLKSILKHWPEPTEIHGLPQSVF